MQSRVLDVLHGGHPEICYIHERAQKALCGGRDYIDDDIQTKVQSCTQCKSQQLHLWEWLEHSWSRIHIRKLCRSHQKSLLQ